MQMFLMVLSLSLVGALVSAVLFVAASRDARRAEAALATPAAPGEERFFLMRPVAPPRGQLHPADVLALQIEHHVRLERAAAEGFLQFPTVESLHTPTLVMFAN